MLFLKNGGELTSSKSNMRAVRSFTGLCLIAALTACGGGGGGGSSASETTSKGASGLTINQSKSALSFRGITQASGPKGYQQDSIQFTATGGSGTYYAVMVADNPNFFTWDVTFTSATSASVTILPKDVPAGKYTGTITFELCSDPQCNSVAWQKAVSYSMHVYDISASGLSITDTEGVTSGAQTISISPADTQGELSATSTDSWIVLNRPSDSAVTVAASGNGVVSGTYQGNVRFGFSDNADLHADVPVALTVGSGIVVPPAKTIDLTYSTSSNVLTGSIPVAFSGGQNANWSASSDASWLVLTNASGTGAGTFQYSIDANQIANLPNWAPSMANVTVSAAGLTHVSFSVTLNKKLPEVYSVWPNPVLTSGGTVKVYGKGFNQLGGWSAIQIQGVTGTSGSINSDTSATVTLPAMSAGHYPVSIPNTLGVSSAGLSLAATSSQSFSYATADNPGEKRSILFDGTRDSVFAINITQNTLVRYRLVGAQWIVDGLPISSIDDMALSSDRNTLYVTSGSNQLIAIDPDTLQIKHTYSSPTSLVWNTFTFRPVLTTTYDNRIWFLSTFYFDAANGAFFQDSAPTALPDLFGYSDGSGMLAKDIYNPRSYRYVTGVSTGTATTLPNFNLIEFNSDGTKALLDNLNLYDMNTQNLIGSIHDSGIITTAVLSPSGDRIYAFATDSTHNNLIITHIDVFDTVQPTDGTSNLAKVGEIAVTDQAWDCPGDPYGCDVHGRLTINTIGNTLFWAGNQRLVVIPIPSNLSGI